jgi:sugar phosphate permease
MKLFTALSMAPILNYIIVTNEVFMKILTFICVLVVGISVYAKTEAGLSVEGFKKKPQRDLAAATVNGLSEVMAQLGKMNGASKAKAVTADNIGFSGNGGALTKPKTNLAAPVAAAETK